MRCLSETLHLHSQAAVLSVKYWTQRPIWKAKLTLPWGILHGRAWPRRLPWLACARYDNVSSDPLFSCTGTYTADSGTTSAPGECLADGP